MATPAEGLARLRSAADAGELEVLCRRHHMRRMTAAAARASSFTPQTLASADELAL